MHEEIICAGFGGQGIMLMGKIIAEAGKRGGYNVTWLPSYGAEVRGGTAHSMVHISSENIASPTVSKPTTCVVMNKPSFSKFIPKIKKDGLLMVNSSMVDEIVEDKALRIAAIPLTKLAVELGNIKVANMIAVGAFARLKNTISLENILNALEKTLPLKKSIISVNKEAVNLGYNTVKKE